MSDLKTVLNQIEGIEASMSAFQEKAAEEMKNAGAVGVETTATLDKLGEQQREIADRLLQIEQSGGVPSGDGSVKSVGKQFAESEQYKAFNNGSAQKARLEIQNNTLSGADANVAPDRKSGVVTGDTEFLTLEAAKSNQA